MNPREELLRRVRDALVVMPEDERLVTMPHTRHGRPDEPTTGDRTALADLFAERLRHHGAQVRNIIEQDIADTIGQVLAAHGAKSVVAPQGLPDTWLATWRADERNQVIDDSPFLPTGQLAAADAVVTSCAAAVADAGIIVLDGGMGQGRRAPTLAPACHVCVVRVDQIGATMPEVIDRLDHRRTITWFGGPSASAESEIDQPPGIRTARQLIVVIVD
ncbi:LutC/YkgG family protein [Nocardia bovistercoris]|uniref:LUD domain-containing protein n=1 Tax=Nocardia bovistercoris TaxID=2785916 RepID=A0A931IA71_9NOCA|nr:LUD domain-containing protein [Nocardia bovistercoris]MBH0776507.1 LUD domain-containing protein [Nocardia bovistercoris]